MIIEDDVIQTADLGRLDFIAEGGQGKVYRASELSLPDCPGGLAYKQYKPGQVTAAGLEAIVSMRSRLSGPERLHLDSITAWPSRVVKDGGQMTGILMPLIPEDFVHTGVSPRTGIELRKEREIQYLFIPPERCTSLGFPLVNLFQRYAICRELAAALAFLAERRVIFGDINAKNALFRVGPDRASGHIMLVDCDAVRVKGTSGAVPQLNAPDWEPPATEQVSLTHETDVFKFGLFVLRCLSPGPNASTARDPRRLDRLLDADGQRLLRASLGSDRLARPKAAEWANYFTQLSNAQTTPAPTPRASPVVTASGLSAPVVPPSHNGWVKDAAGNWVRAG
jgi:hypothetical protein